MARGVAWGLGWELSQAPSLHPTPLFTGRGACGLFLVPRSPLPGTRSSRFLSFHGGAFIFPFILRLSGRNLFLKFTF